VLAEQGKYAGMRYAILWRRADRAILTAKARRFSFTPGSTGPARGSNAPRPARGAIQALRRALPRLCGLLAGARGAGGNARLSPNRYPT